MFCLSCQDLPAAVSEVVLAKVGPELLRAGEAAHTAATERLGSAEAGVAELRHRLDELAYSLTSGGNGGLAGGMTLDQRLRQVEKQQKRTAAQLGAALERNVRLESEQEQLTRWVLR